MEQARVVIVGGGIHGLCTAWSLVRRGHAVTLVERGPLPNPLAASGDHHRIIRRAYGSADGYARTISEAFEAWDALWADLGTRHLAETGVLCVSQAEGDEAEAFRHGLDRGGYPYDAFTPGEAAARWPFLDPDTIRYGFLSHEGGALHCRRIAVDLAAWLAAHGATLRTHTEVTGLDPERGIVTLASGERLEADRIVVTAGAWVLHLLPHLAKHLTVYRTALAYVAPPDDLRAAWATAPVLLDIGGDADAYVVPPSADGGLKLGTGRHKAPTADPDADRTPRPGEGEAIRRWFSPPLARIEEYRIENVVTCAYTLTPDERFLAHREGRVLAVSACSGHGFKFGAAVGRRVAGFVEEDDMPALERWLRAEMPAAA